MIHMHPPDLQRLHDQLRDAIRDHADWHRRVMRTLVCRLPPEPDDLVEDAHRRCTFGRWFYRPEHRDLRAQPPYQAIEAEHARLHRLAARVLLETQARAVISHEGFDEFVDGCARLRLELDSLYHEMEAALRNCDPLTGAYGRVEILPVLREARELALRNVQPSCIAFMDLDRFKAVNDTCGHGVGDQALVGAVRCVTEHLRPYDKVFRYGGDEFLLLLPGVRLDGAQHLVERIRAGLAATELAVTEEGERIFLTASFGLTALEPDLAVEESIGRADKALLLAKAAGRNRVVCRDPAASTGLMLEQVLLSPH
jgi:diguanylate cyclase (GGDEF)-like protein